MLTRSEVNVLVSASVRAYSTTQLLPYSLDLLSPPLPFDPVTPESSPGHFSTSLPLIGLPCCVCSPPCSLAN